MAAVGATRNQTLNWLSQRTEADDQGKEEKLRRAIHQVHQRNPKTLECTKRNSKKWREENPEAYKEKYQRDNAWKKEKEETLKMMKTLLAVREGRLQAAESINKYLCNVGLHSDIASVTGVGNPK